MRVTIISYDLWKVKVPTGRIIGDCTCHYDALDLLVVSLKTDQGLDGWGFGETVSGGVFTRPAPWITPMPSLSQIRRDFQKDNRRNVAGHSRINLEGDQRVGRHFQLHGVAGRERHREFSLIGINDTGMERLLVLAAIPDGSIERDGCFGFDRRRIS